MLRLIWTHLLLSALLIGGRAAWAGQIDILGPPDSGFFGTHVKVLPNGNFVVTDPYFDSGAVPRVGRVYLYSRSGELLATLTGDQAEDQVGDGGVTVLANGHYVITSTKWKNDAAAAVGAVTWRSGNPGGGVIDTEVSTDNSLVGSTADDSVGNAGITVLSNGHYVVRSPDWDGGIVDRGAVTWGDGSGGTVVGEVSADNSLVGSAVNDYVGSEGVTALTNGNYVVSSPSWSIPMGNTNVGAVTWGNGSGGTVGAVSAANSLVGSMVNDFVGVGSFMNGVIALSNGHYVVRSPNWDNDGIVNAGAVTWGNGGGGTVGAVSAANSLVGNKLNDEVGYRGVTALSNGNYVAISPYWDNGGMVNAGAVTWGSGLGDTVGEVATDNSLHGSTTGDYVGSDGVTAMNNGHYVVSSSNWNIPMGNTDVGAVTWGNGLGGTVGAVATENSLYGISVGDSVGSHGVIALSNGDYVISSPQWDRAGIADAGAVTWGNGADGSTGEISTDNSLYGSTAGDRVGVQGLTALSNGNYVISSPQWDRAGIADAGAVTWGNGAGGSTGEVSTDNSLYGSTAGDAVGTGGVTALSNGHYVARSISWASGGILGQGAVTWGNGSGGTAGEVSADNSLIGSAVQDVVGSDGVTALSNGDYIVYSSSWSNGGMSNVGAITWGNGSGGTDGIINNSNSVIGGAATAGPQLVFSYDPGGGNACDQLVVGRRQEDIVTLFASISCLFRNGFE